MFLVDSLAWVWGLLSNQGLNDIIFVQGGIALVLMWKMKYDEMPVLVILIKENIFNSRNHVHGGL